MNAIIDRFWMHPVGISMLFLVSVYVIYGGVRLVRTLQRLKKASLEEAREMSQSPFKVRNILMGMGLQVFIGWFLFPLLNPEYFSMVGTEEIVLVCLFMYFPTGFIWIITRFAKKRIQALAASGDYYAITGQEKNKDLDKANS